MRRRVRLARSAVLRTAGVLMRCRATDTDNGRQWRALVRAWILEIASTAGSERSQVLALHMLEASRCGLTFAACPACGGPGPCPHHAPAAVDGPAWALARYSASAIAFAAVLDPDDFTPAVREDLRRALVELDERLQAVREGAT